MRKISALAACLFSVCSFFSCGNDSVEETNITVSVSAPADHSEQGNYYPQDIVRCHIDVIRDSGHTYSFLIDDFSAQHTVTASDITEGRYIIRAYGRDEADSTIAQTESVWVDARSGGSFLQNVDLQWRVNTGKTEAENCYVRFYDDDTRTTLFAMQTIPYGQLVDEPARPAKDGYVFDGWYWTQRYEMPFDFATTVTGNFTLHAKWTDEMPPEEGKVRVYFYDGTTRLDTQDIEAGETAYSPAAPTKDGYTFAGWYASSDGGNTLNDTPFDFATPINDTLYLYATWEAIVHAYTVTFIGWNGTVYKKLTVQAGECVQRFENPADQGDYTFWYWCADETCTEWADIYTPITEDTTFYAKWVRTCKIYFYKNYDGSDEYMTWNHASGENLWLPDYTQIFAERADGWYFKGWAETPDATEPESSPIENVTTDKTFYALWTQEDCTVTLVNVAKQAEKITQKVGKGAKVQLSDMYLRNQESITIPQGYQCAYAFATADELGTLTEVAQTQCDRWNDAQEITEDKIYYLLWRLPVIAHFGWYWDDEQASEQKNWYYYLYGQPITQPDDPWRNDNGYTFTQWYMDSACTTPIDFATLSAGDAIADEYGWYAIHIYAGWEAKAEPVVTVTLQTISADKDLALTLNESTFTAASGFASYVWRIDGTVVTGATTNTYTVDTTTLEAGTHNVTLAVRDANGTRYSARAVITVQKE